MQRVTGPWRDAGQALAAPREPDEPLSLTVKTFLPFIFSVYFQVASGLKMEKYLTNY